MFIGCDGSTTNGILSGVNSVITWKSSPTPQQKDVLQSSTNPETAIDSVVSSFYPGFGNLITTITPIKFKIPLQAVELSNQDRVVKPIPFHKFDEEQQKWIMQYGNFTSGITTNPIDIPVDTYTDFMLFFFENAGKMGMSSTPGVDAFYSNEIIFDLPDEYAGHLGIEDCIQKVYVLIDSEGELSNELVDLYIDGEPVYTTKIVDSEKATYQVTLAHIMPGENKAFDGSLRRKSMNVFWFNGDKYMTYDIPESKTFHQLSDYKTTPGMDLITGSTFTRLPWDGVEITLETSRVEFEIVWDLADCIELYDNNTPSILSDDILVLQDKFWERIHINVRQYDSNGTEIV